MFTITIAVLAVQLIIFATIIYTRKRRLAVVGFWTVMTLFGSIETAGLLTFQFAVIAFAYWVAGRWNPRSAGPVQVTSQKERVQSNNQIATIVQRHDGVGPSAKKTMFSKEPSTWSERFMCVVLLAGLVTTIGTGRTWPDSADQMVFFAGYVLVQALLIIGIGVLAYLVGFLFRFRARNRLLMADFFMVSGAVVLAVGTQVANTL